MTRKVKTTNKMIQCSDDFGDHYVSDSPQKAPRLKKEVEHNCGTCFHFNDYDTCEFPLPEWFMGVGAVVRPHWGGSCMCWKEKNNG